MSKCRGSDGCWGNLACGLREESLVRGVLKTRGFTCVTSWHILKQTNGNPIDPTSCLCYCLQNWKKELDSDNSLFCTCVFFQSCYSATASPLWRKGPQGEDWVCQPCCTIVTEWKPSELFFNILSQFTIKTCQCGWQAPDTLKLFLK